jgi:hypothetical protein
LPKKIRITALPDLENGCIAMKAALRQTTTILFGGLRRFSRGWGAVCLASTALVACGGCALWSTDDGDRPAASAKSGSSKAKKKSAINAKKSFAEQREIRDAADEGL